ncbi:MAG: hypothetical protein JWR56_2763 [Massilia sp.]|nr:hypothetical protein [Massilia sp.]
MQNSKSQIATPTIKRRLISMVYEAFLLTAVEALAILLYLFATRNQHTPTIDHGRNFVFFLVAAAYFIHAWSGSGHTLAMKTWRIKVVKLGYRTVPLRAAAVRYLMAWGWFLPAIVACYVFGWKSTGQVGAAIAVGIVAWAMTALFDKDRQFLHDKVAGTRLISLPKPVKAPKA